MIALATASWKLVRLALEPSLRSSLAAIRTSEPTDPTELDTIVSLDTVPTEVSLIGPPLRQHAFVRQPSPLMDSAVMDSTLAGVGAARDLPAVSERDLSHLPKAS